MVIAHVQGTCIISTCILLYMYIHIHDVCRYTRVEYIDRYIHVCTRPLCVDPLQGFIQDFLAGGGEVIAVACVSRPAHVSTYVPPEGGLGTCPLIFRLQSFIILMTHTCT